MNQDSAAKIVDVVFQVLIDGSKQDYIGEKISQLEHSLQAAASAREANADEETILAALLHDIGQFATSADQKQMLCDASTLTDLDPTAALDGGGDKKQISVGVTGHERIGAEYLDRLGFSSKVSTLVESHVPVKRYLTGKYPEYYETLSAASKLSLKYQGGPYTQEQVQSFENDPLFELKVQLRQWDDAAKVVDLKVPDLESYRSMAIRHLQQQQQQLSF
ncbi:hypothetical protein FB192DRAFT_1386610 [Mucor lusitanicus]|uniref:HD domain-containing protein n=2 Tax=Mucor circinelloides f. lusitanicus TaxID=29924 RepID=A0A162QUM7_MUCCL|nr:hypothetical protein FB192DRAFT_1386610 [Mucor lusitanicus]OAD05810.1 hypothetical protein MUCCIDRAFT_106367 [Mucor lusitanicus CBS 277.49]